MLDAREFIREKRDGRSHSAADIQALVEGFTRGQIADYQVSAWLMAAFLKGLSDAETDALTQGLIRSGSSFDWSDLGRPAADKHSTGGVGDKISLALAPLAAACGVLVPMVSGRGLGHTGGTLDKLEAIPGLRTQLAPDAMRAQLASVGVVMVGQSEVLAPADGKLYALRDVTSTVENESFIVSSIVSKKVAEGAGALVYDVKCGNGAFMKTKEDAVRLARRLVATTRGLGRKAVALVTDMSQPLGQAVGNAMEVREAVETLQGRGPEDVLRLTLELAATMLQLSGVEREPAAALANAKLSLESGAGWERFLRMVEAQGGDPRTVERADGLQRAPYVTDVVAPRAGRLVAIDSFGLGELVVRIGGGRAAKEDKIDPRVGLLVLRRLGDTIQRGDVLAQLHLAAENRAAVERARGFFRIEESEVAPPPLILDRVD